MDWFADNEVLIQQICVFGIAAAAFQVAMNAGVFSLHGGGTWLLGGYAAAIGLREGLATIPAVALAILVGAVVSLLLSLLTHRLSGLTLAMCTLAFSLIVVVVIRSGGDFTGGALGLYGIPVSVSTAGVIGSAAGVAMLLGLLEAGRWRRTMSALRDDVRVAAAVGIPVIRARDVIMVLSGTIAAFSGALNALLFNAISPELGGFPLVISLLSMTIIGGIGSWAGAYVGAALLLWLPTVSSAFNEWSGAAIGAITIAVVVYLPGGLLGLVSALGRVKSGRVRGRTMTDEPGSVP